MHDYIKGIPTFCCCFFLVRPPSVADPDPSPPSHPLPSPHPQKKFFFVDLDSLSKFIYYLENSKVEL